MEFLKVKGYRLKVKGYRVEATLVGLSLGHAEAETIHEFVILQAPARNGEKG